MVATYGDGRRRTISVVIMRRQKRQLRGPGIQDVEARAVCRRWPMLVLIQPSARIPKDRGLRLRGERKAAVEEFHAALKRGRQ